MLRLTVACFFLLPPLLSVGAFSQPVPIDPSRTARSARTGDSVIFGRIDHGVEYRRITRADGVVLHVLSVDRRSGVHIDAVKADDLYDGLQTVGDIYRDLYPRLRQRGDTVLAAINGGPWDAERFAPVGPLVVDGEVVEMLGDDVWSSFTVFENGMPAISRDRLTGEIHWRNRRMPIASVNHRGSTGAIVLYNRYYAQRVPGTSERTPAEIVRDALSAVEYEDTGIDREETVDTADILDRYDRLRSRGRAEHGSTKAALQRLPSTTAGWYGEPRVNDTMWTTVGAIDTGVVEVPANGYVVSFGSSAEWFSSLRVGDTVRLMLQVSRQPGRVVHDVLPGYPLLLSNGTLVQEPEVTLGVAGAQRTWERTGRTAVGMTPTRDTLLLVVAEPPGSNGTGGLTTDELAEVMVDLGAHDALALDSRGASTMVINDEVVSHRDGRPQRRVSSALLLMKRRQW